jgi:hypothetical protein
VLYAGTIGSGLFKSSTQGNSWNDANGNALNSSTIFAITFSAPHLVVVADNLIFYSDDSGNSWFFDASSPFILTGIPSFITAGDSVMVSTGTTVSRSFDGGVHWGKPITIDAGANLCGLLRQGDLVFAGGNTGTYSSRNFGGTWTHIQSTGLRQGNWFMHHFAKSGNNFLLAYDEIGVGYSSDRGASWNFTLSGFTSAATIDNALFSSGSHLISGTHGDGVYQSGNEGSSWVKTGTNSNTDTLSNSNIFSVLRIKGIVLAGTCGNGLYRSTDKGLTWTRIRNGLPQQTSGFLCVNSLAQTMNNIVAGTDQGLFYSTDLGVSWHATNVSEDVIGIAANGAVACACIEQTVSTNKIYRSTNNGKTWAIVFQTDQADWACMGSDGSTHFYAGTLSSLNVLSNDNGITWRNFGPGIPANAGAFTIATLNNNVFVGNMNGVYFSNNSGQSFTQSNTGFNPSPNNIVQGLAVSSTHVYAGLFHNSVWKRPLSDFGIGATPTRDEEDFYVSIAPNPIISESKLTYAVARRSPVVINLYYADGNLVRNFVNAIQDANDYSIQIPKNGLRQGAYFISVIIGNRHKVITATVK